MKKIFILTAAFAALSFVSCVKEQEVNGPVTVFSATQADMSTKTVIGAADADGCYQPLWVRADRVSVNGVESRLAVVKEEGKLADFIVDGEVSAPYFAVNPSSAFDKREFDQSGNKMNVFVSGTGSPQKYTLNGENITYSANAALVVAHGESTDLKFHHLMAYYKLTITGGETNIKTIYVRQNGDQPNIAGSWNVVFNEQGGIEFTPNDLTSVIKYDCGNDGIQTGKPVLVAVPAYDFENGLILTVKDVEGKFQSYSIPAASAQLAGKAGVIINKSLTFNPQSGTINSADDWQAFAEAVNSGNDWDLYRWVGDGTVKIGQSFTIDKPTKITGKNGKFMYNVDGGGNTITVTNGTGPLFRGVRTEIKNLTIAGAFKIPGKEISTFADSLLSGGLIVNCTNKATLTSTFAGAQYGGGIVRVIVGGGSITGCKNEGAITLNPDASNDFANCYVGGIVGQISHTEDIIIENCSNNAAITVNPIVTNTEYNIMCAGIGGIAGWVRNTTHNVTFKNCDNLANGKLIITKNNITAAGKYSAICVGGVVGIAAKYDLTYRALSTPDETNGVDVTMVDCDNRANIYNCAYFNSPAEASNAKVYTAGLAGALVGKAEKHVSVSNCTVQGCQLLPYDIAGGSDKAGYCAVVGGMIGFGGYVDIDNCISKPAKIGNGNRQSVSFAGVIGFALRPFKLTNSYIWTEGYFNRLSIYQSNRASVAVVPFGYGQKSSMSPAGNIYGSMIENCYVGGALYVSKDCYADTNTSNLSSYCKDKTVGATLFNTLTSFKDNLVMGQGYKTASTDVTTSNIVSWDGTIPTTNN